MDVVDYAGLNPITVATEAAVRFVEMFHPVTEGIAMVPESSVPIHTGNGWVSTENVPDTSSDVETDVTNEEN